MSADKLTATVELDPASRDILARFEALKAERDAARAQVRKLDGVYQAARAWRTAMRTPDGDADTGRRRER